MGHPVPTRRLLGIDRPHRAHSVAPLRIGQFILTAARVVILLVGGAKKAALLPATPIVVLLPGVEQARLNPVHDIGIGLAIPACVESIRRARVRSRLVGRCHNLPSAPIIQSSGAKVTARVLCPIAGLNDRYDPKYHAVNRCKDGCRQEVSSGCIYFPGFSYTILFSALRLGLHSDGWTRFMARFWLRVGRRWGYWDGLVLGRSPVCHGPAG